MELFALYFNLSLFYIKLSFAFWIALILKKETPKIKTFPPSADLALDNTHILRVKMPLDVFLFVRSEQF